MWRNSFNHLKAYNKHLGALSKYSKHVFFTLLSKLYRQELVWFSKNSFPLTASIPFLLLYVWSSDFIRIGLSLWWCNDSLFINEILAYLIKNILQQCWSSVYVSMAVSLTNSLKISSKYDWVYVFQVRVATIIVLKKFRIFRWN